MTDHHRKKANKKRDGRTKYEKGRRHYTRNATQRFKGKKGSDTHNPEIESTTLADVWPKCVDGHIFDLSDDAVCDICGIAKSEVVDMDQYRKEWEDRIERNTS